MNASRTAIDGPLHIGAVKTNIGHSGAASGLSALIKAILVVERGIIQPTRGVTDSNPKIDWNSWRVHIPTEPIPFPKHLPVRRISVNSFGYGGTNAHIIVESPESLLAYPQSYRYTAHVSRPKSRFARGAANRNRPYLLTFSAHDVATLKRNIAAHGQVAANYNILDLSYTLANRRTHFQSRGMVATSPDTLHEALANGHAKVVITDKNDMSLNLVRKLDMALEELDDAPDWTLEEALLEEPAVSRVNETEFSQPLCTAVQIALVQLLRLWNIKPSVTLGHSSGEIAAAFAAGYLSESEAIVLAYLRGQVVKDIDTDGAMMAVGYGAEAITPYISKYTGKVVIACHNSPSSVTLSGNASDLMAIEKILIKEGIFARLLKTNGKAYHSFQMLPAVEKYEALIRQARLGGLKQPKIEKAKMVSSVTNAILAKDEVLDAAYWSANLLNPVLFNQATQTALAHKDLPSIDILIEIGPHSALAGPVRQIKTELNLDKLQYLPTLVRGADCASQMLTLAGHLSLRNYPLNLERVTAIEETYPRGKVLPRNGNLIVDLPPYQWDNT
ncbi:hypothetical protein DL771_008975 [Monosporascus sp. 5C6A]|nr:hypothetical protein DL771_008975 [Monosporascus sp. 5C6A]